MLRQAPLIHILPGFQTGAGESLTRTWIGLWTTTSRQPSPAPRTPGSTHSSVTWTCTVVSSQDPCMGEPPLGHDGGVWGPWRLKPLKLLSCPLPSPPASASGCPRPGLTRSTLAAPFGCSPCRALARMSTCGSVTLMAGRKASASDPAALGPPAHLGHTPCQDLLGQTGCRVLHTLLHLGSSDAKQMDLHGAGHRPPSTGSTVSLPPALGGEEEGTPALASSFLFLGNPILTCCY